MQHPLHADTDKKASPRLRKARLYSLRHIQASNRFSCVIGYKGRLLPRKVAARVLKRLVRSGIDAVMYPVHVLTSPEERDYLKRRYG